MSANLAGREQTVRGTVVALAWDEYGSVAHVCIFTRDEQQYFVESSELGPQLLQLAEEHVEVQGIVQPRPNGGLGIAVKRISRIKGRQTGSEYQVATGEDDDGLLLPIADNEEDKVGMGYLEDAEEGSLDNRPLPARRRARTEDDSIGNRNISNRRSPVPDDNFGNRSERRTRQRDIDDNFGNRHGHDDES